MVDSLMELFHYLDSQGTTFDYLVLSFALVQWVNTDYFVHFLFALVVQVNSSMASGIYYYMIEMVVCFVVGLIAKVTGQFF